MNDTGGVSGESRLGNFVAMVWTLAIHAIFLALLVFGALIINAMIRDWRAGEIATGTAIFISIFGLLMVLIGSGFFYSAYIGAPRFLGGLERQRKKYHHQPWLIKRQWRARRMVYSAKFAVWFMWFWCICWWGILGFLASANTELLLAELRGPWGKAIPAAMPIVAGIIGLLVAIDLTWRRYRYGDVLLLIKSLPGYFGESFRGTIQANLGHRPHEPVGISLTCGSETTKQVAGSNGGTKTVPVVDVLWVQSRDIHPVNVNVLKRKVTLPIEIEIPKEFPESGHILDDPQIVWRLKITPGSVLDRSLRSEFEVPVFARRETER